jgi:uncharacterized protein HemX
MELPRPGRPRRAYRKWVAPVTPTNPTDRELIASQQEALLRETKRADVAIARAEAAEAERDRLRGALERIATDTDDLGYETAAAEAARAALRENTPIRHPDQRPIKPCSFHRSW